MSQWIKIQSYKHDGSLHRCWEANYLLEDNEKFFITASTRTRVIESDGRRWFSKEPAVSFFAKDAWYNIIAMIKDQGIIFYVNIASPTLLDEGMLRYIDYDLDYKLYPDGTIAILDEREYEHHQLVYNYDSDLLKVIDIAKKKVMRLLETKGYPFDTDNINVLYQKFLTLTASET